MGLYCILDRNAILGYARYGQGIGLKEVDVLAVFLLLTTDIILFLILIFIKYQPK